MTDTKTKNKKAKLKVADKHHPLFRNYGLTDLSTIKKGKRKKTIGNNEGVNNALLYILQPYGLYSWGNVSIADTDVTARGLMMDLKFPLENEFLIHQIYGWEHGRVSIHLGGDCDAHYDFYYNLETKECQLCKWSWCVVRKSRYFDTFADMMNALRANNNDFEKTIDEQPQENKEILCE